MAHEESYSLEAMNSGKGGPVPGLTLLADARGYRNPYLSPRSGFDTLITLRGDGVVVFEAVHRLDALVAFTGRAPLSELNMSYAQLLRAFAKQEGRAAKLRPVGGRMVLLIGAYTARRFDTREAAIAMEPLAAEHLQSALTRIVKQRQDLYLEEVRDTIRRCMEEVRDTIRRCMEKVQAPSGCA